MLPQGVVLQMLRSFLIVLGDVADGGESGFKFFSVLKSDTGKLP